jgi:hypothetical protein
VVAEPYKLDLLALPRPPRRAQFPTHYKAPRAVMTPEERELLLGAEAASQNAAAEERPAGLMQSPRAHVASTHALPTGLPPSPATGYPSMHTAYPYVVKVVGPFDALRLVLPELETVLGRWLLNNVSVHTTKKYVGFIPGLPHWGEGSST